MNSKSDSLNFTRDPVNDIQFSDIFNLEDIQHLQDLFSDATGVAAIITYPDGTPITSPSNFCRLCNDMIRKTEKGQANCFHSDAVIGRQNLNGPVVQLCLSGGLWDAGTSITIGGRHIANWLIGQVRNEEVDEQEMIKYAGEIGVNSDDYREALNEVPVMSPRQFKKVSEMLYAFVQQLSEKAYSNFQLKLQIADHQKSTLLLQESETVYRNLVAKLPDGVYKSTHDGKFVDVNPAMVSMLGYESKEDLMNIDIKTRLYFEPTDRESFVLQEKLEEMGVYRLKKKDGSEIWVEDHGWYNLDENGIILFHEGIMRDITERKRAELALQESETLYRNLVEMLPDGLYKSTHEGKFIDVNPAMVNMLGYDSKEDLMAIDIKTQLYFGNASRKNVESYEKRVEMGVYRMKKKDGSEIWVEDHGWYNYDEASNILFHEGIMRDVTERKNAELALIESEAHYRNLLEKLPDGVYKSTHGGKFVDVNPAMIEMLGYESKEDLMNIDIKNQLYFEPGDRESMVLQENLEEMGVFRLKKKDGSEIWVEDHGWYNLDENGETLFHEGIMRDITERKQAEEQIQSKNEELVKLVAEKDKFFSIIAHDLRSPFNSFLGLTSIMAEELPDMTMDQIQKIAVSMKNSATNLFRLLENLLEWSRIQQGLIPFNREVLQLLPVVDESIAMAIESAKIKDIEITINFPYNTTIFADSYILQAIIRNLVSNAVKFTPRGGKISLSARATDDNSKEISIKDSGIGMDPGMIENLFRLNAQVSRNGTAGEPSTGLGLIICKDFIEKHGGKIWVESEEGKGSVFYFTLPQDSGSDPETTITNRIQGNKKDDHIIRKLKILIVDDDETSEMLISLAVKMFSREILKAKSGNEAVDACRNNPDIDLVMMDIKMPGMDGYEATRLIRQFNKDVFIIAQTAFAFSGERDKALKWGCNDFILKPLNIAFLKGLIQKHFNKQVNEF